MSIVHLYITKHIFVTISVEISVINVCQLHRENDNEMRHIIFLYKLSIHLSIHLPINPTIHLFHSSIYPTIHQCIHPFINTLYTID